MMNTIKKLNNVLKVYDWLEVKDTEGIELNEYELDILKEKILFMLDEYIKYCDDSSQVLYNLKNYFLNDVKNIHVPIVVDNTDYNIDECDQELLSYDGYIIINDSRYFFAEEYVEHDTEVYRTVDFSKIIDFNTLKKYIDLFYNDEKCEYDCDKVIFKMLDDDKNEKNTLSILVHHVGFLGRVIIKNIHGNYVKY